MIDLKNIVDPDSLRKRYARVNVYDARTELGYQAKRSGASMAVRRLADLGAQIVEGSADVLSALITETAGSFFKFFLGPEIARDLGLFAGAVGGNIAGVASMGVASGISAGFAQMDYFHQKNNLCALYADEMAAKLDKPAGCVTVREMEEMAKQNPVLEQELGRAKKQRNFAVPLAMVATLASFAVAVYALPALVAFAGLPALATGFTTLAGVGAFAVKAMVSMASYMAVKMPLQALGNRLFGLQDETVNDNIVDIKRLREKGVDITPQDLMPVFIKTNEKLDAMIVVEFGKHYEKLSEDQQRLAVQRASQLLPLEKLARDINQGAMNATGLLFASIGEHSGIARKDTSEAGPAPGGTLFQEKLSGRREPKNTFTDRISLETTAETSITF